MVSQSPDEAVVRFYDILRSTTSCITQVPLKIHSPLKPSDPYRIIFHNGDPVRLRTAHGYPNLLFALVHHCWPIAYPTVEDTFTVKSTYYAYDILDLEEKEILLYHWHPAGVSPFIDPHLHLSSKIQSIEVASTGHLPYHVSLSEMHIRTGHVLIEDVVSVLIDEFKVMPIRMDWRDVIARNILAFHSDRTW